MQPKVVATPVWWLPKVAAPTIGETRWLGIADEDDLEEVAALAVRFWWIWTSESPVGFQDRRAQNLAILPSERFRPVETRRLSTRGLEAVLYEVVP